MWLWPPQNAKKTNKTKKKEVLKAWEFFKPRRTHQFVDGCCRNQGSSELARSLGQETELWRGTGKKLKDMSDGDEVCECLSVTISQYK